MCLSGGFAPKGIHRHGQAKTDSKTLRWTLIAVLLAFVAVADWYAGGVGPRLLLGSATLNLTSEPDDARVLLDGEVVGRTPLRDHSVRPGRTVVRMEHRFHDAVALSVSPTRGEAEDVHVEFPAATGSLEIVSNPPGRGRWRCPIPMAGTSVRCATRRTC